MIGHDQEAELAAARAYNAAIRLAHEVDDQATGDLLTNILMQSRSTNQVLCSYFILFLFLRKKY